MLNVEEIHLMLTIYKMETARTLTLTLTQICCVNVKSTKGS